MSWLSWNCLHLPLGEAQSAESYLPQQGLQQQRRAWELLSCFCFLRLANPTRNQRGRARLPPPGPQRVVREPRCARSLASAFPKKSSVRTVPLGTACRPPKGVHSRTGSQHVQVFSVVVLTFRFPPHSFRTTWTPRRGPQGMPSGIVIQRDKLV